LRFDEKSLKKTKKLLLEGRIREDTPGRDINYFGGKKL